jgi:hypothetical protein
MACQPRMIATITRYALFYCDELWSEVSSSGLWYIATMKASSVTLNQLILNKLAMGEMRLLVLVVNIRKSLGPCTIRGDLSAKVRSALRRLIALKCVVDSDGVYSLCAVTAVAPLR